MVQGTHEYVWDAAGFIFCIWDKHYETLPSSLIIESLVLFNAIKLCFTNSHMQSLTVYFSLSLGLDDCIAEHHPAKKREWSPIP